MPVKTLTSLKRTLTLVSLLIFGLGSPIGGWLLQPPAIVSAEGLSELQSGPTFTVNSTSDDALDVGCSDTDCTLREAITAANAAAGANTIRFSIGDNQTITLTSMLPAISDTSGMLTMDGETHSPAISGSSQFRVLTVSENTQVTLAHLTLANGNYTGGDCSYSSCGGGLKIGAGATANLTEVVIRNSVTTGGGAIYNAGTANLFHVIIRDNSASEGGGILNYGGTLNISDSAIANNSAYYGGGILHNGGVMDVVNSTFSGNSATGLAGSGGGGAIDQYSGASSFNFSTITNNMAVSPNQARSGIWLEGGSLILKNSIVAGNNGSSNFNMTGGTFTSEGYNISNAWNGMTFISTDQTVDPKLETLADNGGRTLTHAIQDDSPAITAANPTACLATDQRGFPRTSGACDTGAYEIQAKPTDIDLSAGSVAENEAANTVVGALSTTDADSGDTFSYTLVTGTGDTDNVSFNISGSNLRSSASFDHETKSSYSIRVRSTDQGGLWVEKQFTITVTNVNEAPTDISMSDSSVAENEVVNTNVGTLTTTDPDGSDTFTYTLVAGAGSNDNASFNIDDNQLRTSELFDYETKGSYSIRIRSTDQGGLTFEKQFTITVTDANEIPSTLSLSAASVADGAAANTVIGSLTTTDPDSGDTFTYSLVSGDGDTDNASFNISSNNLRTSVSIDYETRTSYSIRVRTTDHGGLSFEKQFTITVTDENEAPTDIQLSAGSVAENEAANTVVGALSTTDSDNGDTFTYTLVTGTGDTDNGSFNINGSNLRSSVSFDYETRSSYFIRVRATDSGGLWVEKQFTITVTDSPSDITLTSTQVTTGQSLVGTLSTVGEGISFTYTLQNSGPVCNATNGADNSSFQVDGTALRRLVATLAGTYQVCIQTEDTGHETLQKNFTITVTTAAPQPSAWTAELTSNKVANGDPAGTVVGTAVSSVEGTTFELIDSVIFPMNSAFHLSSDGLLTLAVSVNRSIDKYYPIRILATTPDGRTLVLDAVITVMEDGKDGGAIAGEDHGEVVEGGSIEVDVLSNDTMSSGATSWKTHEIVRYPGHGTAHIGSIIYSPDGGYVGTDTLTYRACDNLDFCVIGSLTLSVRAISSSQHHIPQSGFSPNRITTLPESPTTPAYTDAGDMDLEIPVLGIHAPVVGIPVTTSGWDIAWLGNNVGWLNGSAFPTLNGNSVLTGHVYNSDGTPGIFTDISKLRWGDKMIIRFGGSSYTYEVRQEIDQVDPSDVKTLMAHQDDPWLTLVTCKGYDEKTNTYRWRYIVRAVLTGIE